MLIILCIFFDFFQVKFFRQMLIDKVQNLPDLRVTDRKSVV